MLYSVGTGYALYALAALEEDGTFILAKDLASKLNLPGPYLAKVLQSLVHAGLLESHRGPGGGFRLARPAQDITVGEVVNLLNNLETASACVMGVHNCLSRDKPCPLHAAWSEARITLEETLSLVTVRDLRLANLPNFPAPGSDGSRCSAP